MIAWLLVCQLAAAPPARSVVYANVPSSIVRITVSEWRQGVPPQPLSTHVLREGTGAMVWNARDDGLIVVQFARADGMYLLDGPFEWPREDAHRPIDPRWRRTITGTTTVPLAERVPIQMVSRLADAGSGWPLCYWVSDEKWECAGVPSDEAGVVIADTGKGLLATVAAGREALSLRACSWGRLLIVTDTGALTSALRVTPQQAVVSAQRVRGVRLETNSTSSVTATRVDTSSAWVCGRGSPSHAWLDVRSAHGGPVYVPLNDVSDGPVSIPFQIDLPDTRVMSGTVLSAEGLAAASTLLTAFRLIEPRPTAGAPPAKRVVVAETLAAADGAFEIPGIGEGDYEIVAWHPQFGRATVAIPSGSAPLRIHLQAPGLARGRVVSGGKPVAGVDVISVPDPAAFQAAEDPLDVKGGDARTGADGRFSVLLATQGGGELRVGGGSVPIKRIPLPGGVVPLLELGDIELAGSIDVNVVLDQDPGCTLRAGGPIGRGGLQIVQGNRTGPGIFRLRLPEEGTWALALSCGSEERALSPATFQATPAINGKDVRVVVR